MGRAKLIKKLASCVLALVMTVGLCPAPSFAETAGARSSSSATATTQQEGSAASQSSASSAQTGSSSSTDSKTAAKSSSSASSTALSAQSDASSDSDAITQTGEGTVELYQTGGDPYRNSSDSQITLQSTVDTDALKAYFTYELDNLATSINLSSFKCTTSDLTAVSDAYQAAVNENPDLFYVDNGYGYSKSTSDNGATWYIYEWTPSYLYSTSSIPSMKTKYAAAMNNLLSWVPSNATTANKVKAVHDWLVRNCAYKLDYNYDTDKSPWSAYGALVNKSPVCQGYSLAFRAAMNRLGIECTYVSQHVGSEGHGWNRVKVDGYWYNVDVTFDDPTSDGGFSQTPRTTYFMKSDSWWKNNAYESWHSTWTPAGVAGTNTQYDSGHSWPTYSAAASSSTATSFTLSSSSLTMGTYESHNLTIASVTPSTANKTLAAWSSSDTSVASVDSDGTVSSGTHAGIATITCKLGNATRTCTVTVKGGAVSQSDIAKTLSSSSFTYNAASQKPTVTLTQSTNISGRVITLTEGTDYTLTWPSDTTSAGSKKITITGKGYYSGTASLTYTIAKANVSLAAASSYSTTYTGSPQTPNIVFTLGGRTLAKGTDYTISCTNNTNAGTANYTITGINNCTGTKTGTFTISPLSITNATVSGINSEYTYTGRAITPMPTLRCTVGLTTKYLRSGTDYTIEYSSNTDAGIASIIMYGMGNFCNAYIKMFDINPVSMDDVSLDDIATQDYTGSAVTPNPVLTFNNQRLQLGTDYNVTYYNNVEAGTATVVVSGVSKGNFTGTKYATFDIKKLISSTTVTGVASTYRHTGGNIMPVPTVTDKNGKRFAAGTDYTVTYCDLWGNQVIAPSSAGTYTAVITGQGAYEGTKTATFAIASATVTRLWGTGGLDTMKQIVDTGWTGGCGGTVIVATDGGYYDALTASALAGVNKGSVLLTNGGSLSPQTAAELARIKPSQVIVVGGRGAVTDNVKGQIATAAGLSGLQVKRVYGNSATDTADAIWAEAKAEGLASDTCIIATSDGFADALSVAPAAYAKGYPIFLAGPGATLSQHTLDTIRAAGFTKAVVIGGTGALPTSKIDDVLQDETNIYSVSRCAGGSCYETSSAVAKWEIGALGMKADGLAVATADSYQDALCGAALCGKNNAILVLAVPSDISCITGVVHDNAFSVSRSYIYGGAGVLPDVSVRAPLVRALG